MAITGVYKTVLFGLFKPNITCVRTLKNIKSIKRMRGLPPYKAKTLSQKLAEAEYRDPAIHYKVNIGLPRLVQNHSDVLNERLSHTKKLKEDEDFEKKARTNNISLCLDEVTQEWIQESAPQHIKEAAEYYGVFQDLFGDAFFYPQVNLEVTFKNEEHTVPVYRGNLIKPNQAVFAPDITYDSDHDSLWTLVVTNPDGHLEQENSEYLHWFLGNIPGNNVSHGEVIADYFQPLPARGTGFQRFVFILYKQNDKINYSTMSIPTVNVDLSSRTFKTYDFYRKHQDKLTPAGLAFCQVNWDFSVSKFFHTALGMEEPVYEYDFDPHYHPKEKLYPIRQPFNLYMDRYRDPKQIAKEYLLMKLKNRHPFEEPKPPLRFPNAERVYHDLDERLFGRIPSWLKREKRKQRLGHGRINDY